MSGWTWALLYILIGFALAVLAAFLDRKFEWDELEDDENKIMVPVIIFMWPLVIAGLVLIAIPFSAIGFGRWLADIYDDYRFRKNERTAEE